MRKTEKRQGKKGVFIPQSDCQLDSSIISAQLPLAVKITHAEKMFFIFKDNLVVLKFYSL